MQLVFDSSTQPKNEFLHGVGGERPLQPVEQRSPYVHQRHHQQQPRQPALVKVTADERLHHHVRGIAKEFRGGDVECREPAGGRHGDEHPPPGRGQESDEPGRGRPEAPPGRAAACAPLTAARLSWQPVQGELGLGDLPVGPGGPEQVRVRSLRHEPAVVEDEDLVRHP